MGCECGSHSEDLTAHDAAPCISDTVHAIKK